MPAAIEISELTKRFGHTRALDSLTMTVQQGEVHAFLGPNGAGKSTTLRILLGMLRASGGQVRVLGKDPWRDSVSLHRDLAYVPSDVSLWPTLTGGETIDLLHRIRGGVDRKRRDALVERFELDPSKKTRSYSKGNRQKVALIAALSCDVELFVLDEPTSGLDPLMERVFQNCVAELQAAGRTVLLSSHILGQIDKLSDSVTIIRAGRAVQQGRLADLRHLHRLHVRAKFEGAHEPVEDVAALQGVHAAARREGSVTFTLDRVFLPATLAWLASHGVTELESQPVPLEELFLHEYAER